MKKILCFIFILAAFQSKAQCFKEGEENISFGSGTPNLDRLFFSAWQGGQRAGGAGPFHLRIGHAISDKIEMALSLNHSFMSERVTFQDWNDSTGTRQIGWKADVHNISLLLRMNIHFAVSDNIDPYFGIGAGHVMRFSKVTAIPGATFEAPDDYYYPVIPFGMEIVVGMRYYATPRFGFYTELGIAKSILQFGLTFKPSNKKDR